MTAINADTAAFWNKLAQDLGATRPSVGKRVRVTSKNKHNGKEGVVVVHKISRYGSTYRYCSDASAHMRDMRGTDGWYCTVQTDTGERFNVDATKVEVVLS